METKPEYKLETKALVPYQSLTPQTWQMIMEVAKPIHESRLFGTRNVVTAAVTMLKGYEMGLSLTSSFEFIQVIQGHAGLSPRGALALIQQSPFCAKIEIKDIVDDQGDPWACTVMMERTNGVKYTVTVTIADAERAGLVKKGSGWENWPANMLRWRAVGFCADVVFPDVIGGMKRTDELGANLNQEGEVVDATPSNDPWTATVKDSEPEPEPVEPKIDLAYLAATWGPLQVMEATQTLFNLDGPTIPNESQIATVAAKLKQSGAPKMGEAF